MFQAVSKMFYGRFKGNKESEKYVSRKCVNGVSMKFCFAILCCMNLIAATRAEVGLVFTHMPKCRSLAPCLAHPYEYLHQEDIIMF